MIQTKTNTTKTHRLLKKERIERELKIKISFLIPIKMQNYISYYTYYTGVFYLFINKVVSCCMYPGH